jgi:hypothetical protein
MKTLLLSLALFAVACGGQTSTDSGSSSSDGATTESPSVPERVLKAAEIAKAIQAAPDKADEILAEHGMTQQAFADLMNEIAQNEEWSKAYEAARRP